MTQVGTVAMPRREAEAGSAKEVAQSLLSAGDRRRCALRTNMWMKVIRIDDIIPSHTLKIHTKVETYDARCLLQTYKLALASDPPWPGE